MALLEPLLLIALTSYKSTVWRNSKFSFTRLLLQDTEVVGNSLLYFMNVAEVCAICENNVCE